MMINVDSKTYRGESTHTTRGIDASRDSRLGLFLVRLAAAFQAESILSGWWFQSISKILNNIKKKHILI